MDRNDLIRRLEGFEWTDFEVKEALWAVPKSAYETVSAFANTSGGHLVFGVEEGDEGFLIVGVIDVDKVQNEFFNTLRSRQKISCQLETSGDILGHKGNKVLVFFIPEARRQDKPVYLNGDIRRSFIRRGGSDQRCTDREIKRYLRNASGGRFDGSPISRELDRSFDGDSIRWYRDRFERNNPTSDANRLSDIDFLEYWGLVVEQDGRQLPTVASVLLFGNGPALRTFLARAVVDCFFYVHDFDAPQEDVRWQDRRTLEGNLVQTWQELLGWYLRRRDIPFHLDSETLERRERPEDYVSFREAAINLLTHQDYQVSGRNATISIYSDRLAFKNPGAAFEDKETLLSPGDKEVRNPLVVEAFRRIGIGERAGTGLRAIYRDRRRLRRVPPEIENDAAGYRFRLILLNEALLSERQLRFQASLGVNLGSDQAAALALLCRVHSVSATELSLSIGPSKGEIQDLLQSLITHLLAAPASGKRYRLAGRLRERWLATDSGPPASLATDQARGEASLVTDQAPDEASLDAEELSRIEREGRLAEPIRRPAITELDDEQRTLLDACAEPQAQKSLMRLAGVASRGYFRRRHLKPLLDSGLLRWLYPDRPTHPQQRIVLTRRGRDLLAKMPRKPVADEDGSHDS